MTYCIQESPKHIFRAYDIRGVVNEDLTENGVYTIGRAYAALAQNRTKQVVIARDGRHSGPAFLKALQQGLIDGGLDVINVGAVPSPVCYFAAHKLKTYSSIMVTGSHNPKDYNGLKLTLANETLACEKIQNLYDIIQQKNFPETTPGTVVEQNVCDDYIKVITQQIKPERPLKIAIDCGNGITGMIAPQLYKALDCEVVTLFDEVDGDFPNHHPDPSKPENLEALIKLVKAEQCDLGLAFDGDGDRLGVVTQQGEIIWPDRQMIIFARNILLEQNNAKIIFDVKCTRHLPEAIRDAGGIPIMGKTGHSFMKDALKQHSAPLAGEMSGHIFFNDKWYGFDDALYAGARLIDILSQEADINSVFDELPNAVNTPEITIPVAEHEKFAFISRFIEHADFSEGEICTLDGIRVDFPDGFGLIRASNTTPCLVMRFEGDDESSLERIEKLFKNILRKL